MEQSSNKMSQKLVHEVEMEVVGFLFYTTNNFEKRERILMIFTFLPVKVQLYISKGGMTEEV